MKTSSPKSAYLGWLAGAFAPDHARLRLHDGPDDIVLGYATGYDAAMIAPFVRSLRSVFHGTVVLVVDDRPDVNALLAQYGVEAIYPEATPGWKPHPVMERFAAYARVLERFPNAVDVLITDVRDVVFQAEPFGPPPRKLEVFVEFENGVLGEHAFNMKYLTALVGDEMASLLKGKPCICIGTVIGPRDEIIRFCRTLLMLAAIPRSELGGAFGADQAACNLAVHLGLVKAEVKTNFGRVATIGMTPSEALTLRDDQVVNPDGSVSPIVHQHDRHPHLDQAIHALWGEGMRHCKRVAPRTVVDQGRRLRQSFMRRLPELR